MKNANYKDILPVVRYAGEVTVTARLPRIAYDHRLFFILSDCGRFTICGEQVDVSRGDMLILLSGTPYTIEPSERGTTLISINFDFFGAVDSPSDPEIPLSAPGIFDPKEQREPIRFEEGFLSSGWGLFPACFDLLPDLHALVAEAKRGELLSGGQIRAYMTLCLNYAFRRWYADEALSSKKREERDDLLSFLARHCTEDISNRTIAERFHYHPNYVSQLVKTLTGLPLHRYLLNQRIRLATDLLLSTDLPVSEISVQCGFRDLSYFTYYFRTVMGYSPVKFRKN